MLSIESIRFKTVLKFLVSCLLILYLVKIVDYKHFNELLTYQIIFYLMISIVLLYVFTFFMALRWKLLIENLATVKAPLFTLQSYYLIGSFFNIFLPGSIGGDLTRINNSNKSFNLGILKASLIVFVERVCGVVGLSAILSVGVLFFSNNIFRITFGLPLIILSGVFLGVVILKKYFEKKDLSITYRLIILVFLLSIMGQFCDIMIAHLFCRYFNLQVGFNNLLVIMPLVYIATILPISIGGLGVREGTIVGLFSLFGVDTTLSVAVSLLMYFSKVGIGFIGWLVYLRSK